jgi:hypothetical protein
MASTTKSVPQHSNPHIAAILGFASSGKAGSASRTPNEWVQAAVEANALPKAAAVTSSGVGKAIGRSLRGHIGRATGNGVGRGRTYPPTTARELLLLSGYSTRALEANEDKARQVALDKAHSTWDKAHARRAKGSQPEEAAKPARKSKPAPKPEAPVEQAPVEEGAIA